MINKKSVFEHTQSNMLVIPQALFAMKDVQVVSQFRNSAIFYKNLEQDLVDVAFYTKTPCFIYIESGREVITNEDHETIELGSGSSIFLPQGLNLQSDFVKQTESLKAYLVFFDDDILVEYLASVKASSDVVEGQKSLFWIAKESAFADFFNSFRVELKASDAYLKLKLLELLHLIAWKDSQHQLHGLLTSKRFKPKPNLMRLLDSLDVQNLSVSDLADLSGRSLSSFNRDFKLSYQQTPKKWLQEKKLAKAKDLLADKDLSVTEVAISSGYENVSAFIKAFKLKYGVTPKQIKTLI